MWTILYVALCAAAAGATITWLVVRRLNKALAADLDSVNSTLSASLGALDAARSRADQYYRLIEGCEREARQAKELYIRCGAEHAAAQSMMLRERERLVLQYRALKRQYEEQTQRKAPEPAINQIVETVAADFRERHVANPQIGVPPQPAVDRR